MRRRMQHTPKLTTIGIALVLVFVGVLGTFAGLIPDLFGVAGETIGVGAQVLAALLMLAGVFFERV